MYHANSKYFFIPALLTALIIILADQWETVKAFFLTF
jgi:hypothetical protein